MAGAQEAARAIIEALPEAPREHWEVLVAIAGAETKPAWNPLSLGDHYSTLKGQPLLDCLQTNCGGYCSFGLWQIFLPVQKENIYRALGVRVDANPCAVASLLTDPRLNARVAAEIYRQRRREGKDPFQDWSAYKKGHHRNYLTAARLAVSEALAAATPPATPTPQPAPTPAPQPAPPQVAPRPAPGPGLSLAVAGWFPYAAAVLLAGAAWWAWRRGYGRRLGEAVSWAGAWP